MIKYKHGNIVDAMLNTNDIDLVFHQANCFNTMGAGVAKDLAGVFPGVAIVDNQTAVADKRKMGGFTKAEVLNQFNHPMQVFNLYGQYAFKYGTIYKWIDGIKHIYDIPVEKDIHDRLMPMTSIPHLREAIIKMLAQFDINQTIRYATVKIGCGRGGADWDKDGYPLLDGLFAGRDLTVYRF